MFVIFNLMSSEFNIV